jgi:alkanesulfonate monooxygenase SsuD/methylene tetrahydromethanopterin reductase-like flavin-dependent oxidoreductase (luciferase family)
MTRCWTGERASHHGEVFRFGGIGCLPRPRQRFAREIRPAFEAAP